MPRITNRPNIPASALRGEELKQDDSKVVSTKSHDIEMSTFASGQWMPDFKLTRRQIEDPEPRSTVIDVSPARLGDVRTADDFKALLTELKEANKDWLFPDKQAFIDGLPEGDRSAFAFYSITGRRIETFFDEVMTLVSRSGLRGDAAADARREINFAHRDAFRDRSVVYDKADTNTYWSYGHDAPFVHVFEKMLETLPEDSPKRPFIQAQIDYVFSKKYVPDGGVREYDAENSLDLMAIDKESRHVVSITKDSADGLSPRYETLQVPDSAGGDHAGKYAYRDGDNYFLEGTGAELPADLVDQLVSKPAGDITFRRPLQSEAPRSDFKYDWNGNRMLNAERIDTGWWGHCDIQAMIETILADMKGSAGVTEYNAASGATTEFNRAMQLEALAALLNFDDIYLNASGGQAARLGETDFAGGRFDDRASKMTLKTDRGNVNLNVKISGLFKADDPSAREELDKIFATKIADDDNESFTENDAILRTEEHDTNYIDASGRKLEGMTEGYSFDSRGRPVESKTSFTIDPKATSGDRVLIGNELTDMNNRELNRFYFDPSTQEVIRVDTQFVEENGEYVAKEGSERVMGKLTGMELGREMTAGDDLQNKIRMLEDAVRSGDKIATDSDKREQVWNGQVNSIELKTEWRSDDGQWERVGVHVDARFGYGKVGTILHKLDDNGEIVDSLEVKAAVDFYWRDRPRVAPLVSERGNWYVNRSMYERGVVDLGDGLQSSLGAMRDLNDLIYLGLKHTDGEKVYTIAHEGKRFVYSDEAVWKEDIAKIEGGQSPGGGTTDPDPDPTDPAGPVRVTRSANLDIPDNDPAGVADTVSVDREGKVKDLKLEIDLKHTYVGDLNVALVAPDGTEVLLHKRGGRGRDDIVGTYGDDLTSHDRLDALFGKEMKGDWQLKVTDLAGRDVGSLVSWGLSIEAED